MFPTPLLTTLLLLVVSVAAKPIVVRDPLVSLPFARTLNITGAHDLVNKDQGRARDLFSIVDEILSGILGLLEPGKPVSVGVTNSAVAYVASVGVGSPPTSCERPCFISSPDFETRF